MAYFPVFLQIRDARALVVGGGRVALRKCRDLRAAGANVTVVAPDFCAGFSRMRSIERLERRFRVTDVRGCVAVIAATDSTEVNVRVASAARRSGIPVNVVDDAALSTFIVPAVLRRGPVVVAVSTGGASPTLARNVRDGIDEALGPGLGGQAEFLARARPRVLRAVIDPRKRRRIFERLAKDDVRKMIEKGGTRRASAMLRKMIREAVE